MAIINKTGITDGGTIQAEHVTRAIDALSGGSTDSVAATGSFTGSFTGQLNGSASFATTASFALNASGTGFPYTGSARITGSLVITGSLTNRNGDVSLNGSSHVISGSTDVFINTPTLKIFSGTTPPSASQLEINVQLGDTSTITGTANSIIDFSENGNSGNGFFRLPLVEPTAPKAGYMYWSDDQSKLYIYSDNQNAWLSASFG